MKIEIDRAELETMIAAWMRNHFSISGKTRLLALSERGALVEYRDSNTSSAIGVAEEDEG